MQSCQKTTTSGKKAPLVSKERQILQYRKFSFRFQQIWLCFHFCITRIVIFSSFSETSPPRGVSRIFFSHLPQFLGQFPHYLSLEFLQLSVQRHLSMTVVALFRSRYLCLQLSTGPHLGSITNHSDAQICQRTGCRTRQLMQPSTDVQ